jgi:hypothetical protein
MRPGINVRRILDESPLCGDRWGRKRVQLGVVLDHQRDRKDGRGARVLFMCIEPTASQYQQGVPITTWDATIPRTTKQGSRRINIADMILCKPNGLLRIKCSKVRDAVETQRPDGDVMILPLSTN